MRPPAASPQSLPLTPRQREVMHWAREGKSSWEMGKILGCAEETVKKHLQKIYRLLEVPNRAAAVHRLEGISLDLPGEG